jgi:hypothetical protein
MRECLGEFLSGAFIIMIATVSRKKGKEDFVDSSFRISVFNNIQLIEYVSRQLGFKNDFCF